LSAQTAPNSQRVWTCRRGRTVRSTPGTEMITLAPAEQQRWRAALAPMIETAIADADKAGVHARDMLRAAGYLK